ncbi:hypothetical protein NYE80_10190 [Paenibacillus sp. FSL H7-0357]|uniref:hypothetical protein n=1 Tax=Paenibacillus sp. FSL H7-0357 TaxID=1536774 RepID=UPI00068D16B9|nr:hypothetical protein [Paenibacillus sp. FSL H7-0357]
MPADSFPFPMFSGLLTPDHCKKIGSALWLFVWCISSTTAEVEDDGTVWGIVLGGKPMKLSEIGANFGVKDKTVSRWISDLQDHGYLHITRAPRGLIIKVKHSKKGLLKRSDKNVRSSESDQTILSDQSDSDQTYLFVHSEGDQTKMSDHGPELGSDQTKMSDAKDIITTTTITKLEKEWWEEEPNQNPPADDGYLAILDAYCKMHSKFDIHVSTAERHAMGQIVAGGITAPFTIQTMETMYKAKQAKQARDNEPFEQPNSFAYYVKGIEEAWRKSQGGSKSSRKPKTPAAQSEPPRKTKQQQELEDLKRRAKEAKELEESTSY